MPLNAQWRKATRENVKQNVPESPGVYELRCFGKLVYVGSSKNLQKRLLDHVSRRNPNRYRYKTTWFFQSPKARERAHYDAYEDSNGKPPSWNKRRPSV